MSKQPLECPIMSTGMEEVVLWTGGYGKPEAENTHEVDVVCRVDRTGARKYTASINAAIGTLDNGYNFLVSIDSHDSHNHRKASVEGL